MAADCTSGVGCAFAPLDAHGAGRPRLVGAGIELAGYRLRLHRPRRPHGGDDLVGKLGDGTPILLAGRLGLGLCCGLAATLARRRAWRGPVAEQVGRGQGRDFHGKPRRNLAGNGGEQPGGVGNARLAVDVRPSRSLPPLSNTVRRVSKVVPRRA